MVVRAGPKESVPVSRRRSGTVRKGLHGRAGDVPSPEACCPFPRRAAPFPHRPAAPGPEGAGNDPDERTCRVPRHLVPGPAAPPAAPRPPGHRSGATIPICLSALLLAACTGGPSSDAAPAPRTRSSSASPTPSQTVSKDPSLLGPDEATAIVTRLRGVVKAERTSTAALSPLIIGPYRDRVRAVRRLRTGSWGTSTATPSASTGPASGIDPDEIGQDVASPPSADHLLLTRGRTWPRWFLTAGDTGQRLPRMSVLLSTGQGTDYGIWAQMLVLPGRSVPAVAPATEGAQLLEPDTTGLLSAPSEVARGYADLLNRGDSSAFASRFSADDFRKQVREQLSQDRKRMVRTQNGAQVPVGKVTSTHTVRPDGVLALRTADGGALVIAALRQTQVLEVTQKGGKLQPDPILSALAGKKTFTGKLTRVSAEVVAFTVPRAGSGGKITVIGATKGDVAASGS